MLKQWFWKNGITDINTMDLWEKMASYPYLPRLLDSSILQSAISTGVSSSEYFGYADGKEGDEYRGLKLKEPCAAVIDRSSLIVELETARACKKAQEKPEPSTVSGGVGGGEHPPVGTSGEDVTPQGTGRETSKVEGLYPANRPKNAFTELLSWTRIQDV